MVLGRLGIIGFGNMGSAITKGLVDNGLFMASDIHVHDIDVKKQAKAKAAGHFIHTSIKELSKSSNSIIISVKPKDVIDVVKELVDIPKDMLIISVAAGVSLKTIESVLVDRPVVRVMPNTPCMVGAGVCVLARGSKVKNSHIEKVTSIMRSIGFVSELPETLMDAVTGLSGSGPAYVAIIIDALADGGVKVGLPRDTALKLAAQTVFGTAKMILEKRLHPALLRDMVASPGGTTIEGISVLETSGIRAALIDAVEAAAKKSKNLSHEGLS